CRGPLSGSRPAARLQAARSRRRLRRPQLGPAIPQWRRPGRAAAYGYRAGPPRARPQNRRHQGASPMIRWFFRAGLIALPLLIAAPAHAYTETPSLADKVKGGELPPIADRLPANPRVIDLPAIEIGR